jgi:hypothetical protein
MFISIVAFLKEYLYEEVSLQIDTIFYNTPLVYLNIYIFYVKTPLKTLMEKQDECTLI